MKKAIFGNGGHAREVMSQMGLQLPCFVDDEYLVKGTHPLSEFDPNEFTLMVAVSNSQDRFKIIKKLPKQTKFFSWVHPSVLIMDNNIQIGEGSFIGANSILTTNIRIGKHAILNRGVQVGHDTEIGDYFSAMPGSIVSGNVKIHDLVYLGNNCSVREKISIHNSVTIGMNAAVVKNIDESGTYVGVPTKKIK
jgi:sugar O-acyltransferase (sialic acid O-acetyltransferase NeuD family)